MKQFYRLLNAVMLACLRASAIFAVGHIIFGATAATADRATTTKTQGLLAYPVAANVTIYKGTMVCLNSSGYAVPAADTSGYSSVIGIAYEQVAGGASNGTYNIRVQHNIVALFTATSITQAMVGTKMYAVADNEFDDSSSNSIFAGTLQRYVSSTSGWILVAGVSNPVAPTGTVAGTLTVTSASASALAVGRLGATTPALQVDASAATSVTGLKITAGASGGGLALAVVGATNEALTIDAQGSGTLTLNGTATGAITLARATGVTGALTVTSASASALAVGRLGATTPAFAVSAVAGTQVTGVIVTGNAAGSGAQLAVQGGNAAETLDIDAKGTGNLRLQTTGTGHVVQANGDYRNTAGNLRTGAISAFGTTEPTSAWVMKQGTAAAGAITTSAGIFTDGTVIKKIIAAGTVSNIET